MHAGPDRYVITAIEAFPSKLVLPCMHVCVLCRVEAAVKSAAAIGVPLVVATGSGGCSIEGCTESFVLSDEKESVL